MMTERENFLRTLNNDNPERLCCDFLPFGSVRNDPVTVLDRGNRVKGETHKDIWGTEVAWPLDQPGAMPHITNENKVIKDITKWKEQLVLPDYPSMDLDWSACHEAIKGVNREEKLLTLIMGTGIFERLHFLMGFQDTFINLMIHPKEMHELLDAILKVRMEYVSLVAENMKPEVIIHHDDLGTKTSLFFNKAIWDEFFKERYRKLYTHMRDLGIIVIHHSDSWCESIAEDMAEVGIQVWQGAVPENDIPAIQKKLGGKMLIMGGIDAGVDRADATEEEIRKETRRACETYAPLGGFMPCITYGAPGSLFPGVIETMCDEIMAYNKETYGV